MPCGLPPARKPLSPRAGRAAMPGVTACLLGNLDVRREFGKVGTQSDIHLHDYKHEGTDVTVMVPDRYPDQLKCLSYALANADAACLVVDEINATIGEQILAADAAGIRHGTIILRNYLQPEQLAPLLAGTNLEGWTLTTEEDWVAARSHLAAAAPERNAEATVLVPIDHHFDVKGVGAVILGVVQRGTLKKNDTLHAYPEKVICPVRSIQIHDADHAEAGPGDRVGLALRNTKADQLDRGMVLAPPDADLVVKKAGDAITFNVDRSPFSKQDLAAGSVVHLGIGMQFVPVRLTTPAPAPGTGGPVEAVLEKGIVHASGENGILWHVDNHPQRVVGRVSFD